MAGAPKGNKNAVGNKGGAPKGNKNAIGNKGGAPKGNVNAFTLGNYTKRIPMAVKNIMEELATEDPLDKLWRSICIQEARIIYMQNNMHVKNKKDITKELKKTKVMSDKNGNETYREEEYEIQLPWDKEANLMVTQSKAYDTLVKLIKQYDEMLNANRELATEEQKIRIKVLKSKVQDINTDVNTNSTKKLDSILEQMKRRKKDE
ncbi:uncharacterized protein YjcR [Clostridium beijerinckii]|uniref:Uncharacterized protein YjcR n=2 Tax=Clostridium beijerinckii TaxID=1520 RepID=A0AAE5LS51_CLOBE|nr:phage terminase small subunit [Clostridium beijerinckii]NOW85321.1 uncharacterized protein YjcR [Clostridium beijerinckii]NSB16469.1 uncharacterized protein YjcR [Clostridium beijerinckii]OOM25674.1 hypothetical protein CLOBE_34690 [Clostridium beijerinckii]